MAGHEGLPSSRQSLLGISSEGDEVWLIRGIAQKQYTCPGCYGDVEIGEDHVIAQTVMRLGGTEHRHWHRGCAKRILEPGLSRVKAVNARESGRQKLVCRGMRAADAAALSCVRRTRRSRSRRRRRPCRSRPRAPSC